MGDPGPPEWVHRGIVAGSLRRGRAWAWLGAVVTLLRGRGGIENRHLSE